MIAKIKIDQNQQSTNWQKHKVDFYISSFRSTLVTNFTNFHSLHMNDMCEIGIENMKARIYIR